jgi:hypothetical protein
MFEERAESLTSRYSTENTTIFSSFGGSSWHRADANLIFWVCLDPMKFKFVFDL